MSPCHFQLNGLRRVRVRRRCACGWRAGVTFVTFMVLLRGCVQEQKPQCTFVPKAQPAEWDCGAMAGAELTTWDIKQAAQFAVKHSPIVYMHPAEEYVLTDPKMYWQAAHLYSKYYQKLNKTAVMAAAGLHESESGGRNRTGVDLAILGHLAYSFLTILPTDPDEAMKPAQRALVHGSPIDEQGRSSARVFYQLLNVNGAWVYTYNLYYAWNGCGNLAFVTPDGHDKHQHTLEFISCPESVHESDWERVSMVVCPTNKGGIPVAALLSQHNHHRLLNCTKPLEGSQQAGVTECDWHFGDDDGTFFLDRTAQGGPIFVPNNTNVLPLPGLIPDMESNPEDAEWASYPGWWGTAEWKLPGRSITCLSANRNQKVACPDNLAWRIVAGQSGIAAQRHGAPAHDTGVMQPYLDLPDDPQAIMAFDYHKLGGAKQGPAFRPWAHHWVGANNPPLWELPLATMLFRLLLNNGQTEPVLTCFTPMVASDDPRANESSGPPVELGADPWGAVLLLLTIPITLFTASAIKHTLDPTSPPPFASIGGLSFTASSIVPLQPNSTNGGIRLPSLLQSTGRLHSTVLTRNGWWAAFRNALPGWAGATSNVNGGTAADHDYAGSAGGDYAPIATAAAEVELGGVPALSPGNGLRRHSQSKAGPLLEESSPHAASLGGSLAPGSSGARSIVAVPGVAGARRAPWARTKCAGGCAYLAQCSRAVRKQHVVCVASCLAWVMYAMGLHKSFIMVEESLPVITPLLTILYILLQTAAAVLAACDTYHCVIQPRYVPPTSTIAPHSQGTSWHESPGEDEDEQDVHRPESFGMRGRAAVGSSPAGPAPIIRRWGWFGVFVHRVVNFAGPGLCTTLLVTAVVLLVAQCAMQGVCRELIFSHISINPPTTAAGIVGPARHHPHHSRPNHEVLDPGAAAVLLPIGAVNGVEFPARLYVASLCIGWRERFGGGLLAIGAIIWSVVHLVWERHKH